MSLRRRGSGAETLNPWPGYVDALSTLLMVIIFVLLVFVLAQAFLSVALSGKDRALDRLNRQMAELSDMLSLERSHSTDLQSAVASLTRDLAAATAARDQMSTQLDTLQTQLAQAASQRDALIAGRTRLAAELSDATAQSQSASARLDQLQKQLADSNARTDSAGQQAAAIAAQLAAARAELDRTVKADKATIDARLADIARLGQDVQALTALRDQMEAQAKAAAAKATTDDQARAALQSQLADEQRLSDSARAQIALMNRQLEQLRAQIASVSAALDAAQQADKDKDAQITNLGARLNAALAAKVEELQRYRSEFFGRLRDVLANRPGIQVVGDRFVFQSEVLFPPGNADLSQAGQAQVNALASTMKVLVKEIPPGLPWVLRVDGHADKQPLPPGSPFASNWELSSQRAINVVKLLIQDGVPASHLAATGFADNQALDPADTADAFAKNRRIELRLTDR